MTRTAAQHLAGKHNLRQRRPLPPLSERGQRVVEQGKRSRVELTPTYTIEKPIARETAEGN